MNLADHSNSLILDYLGKLQDMENEYPVNCEMPYSVLYIPGDAIFCQFVWFVHFFIYLFMGHLLDER